MPAAYAAAFAPCATSRRSPHASSMCICSKPASIASRHVITAWRPENGSHADMRRCLPMCYVEALSTRQQHVHLQQASISLRVPIPRQTDWPKRPGQHPKSADVKA